MTSARKNQGEPLNRSMRAAKATKQDEFYTQLSDIEKELRHYTKHFMGKAYPAGSQPERRGGGLHHPPPL